MKSKITFLHQALFVCLPVAFAILAGCKPSGENASAPAASAQQYTGYFRTPFQEESQFIVEAIVSDIAEQVFYAKNHQVPEAKSFSVHAAEKPGSPIDAPIYNVKVTLDAKVTPVELEVNVNGPIWSAEVYKDLTATLAKAVNFEPPGGLQPADKALLKSLLDGLPVTIEQENQTLSSGLEGDFSNADLHQQAALLLGAFILRAHESQFEEFRSPLCRITAHLAMARLMAGESPMNVNGNLAEAMLLTLIGNQQDALAKLKTIDTSDDSLERWVRVLKACNTGDFRPFAGLKSPSPVERVAGFQTFYQTANRDIAWDQAGAEKTNRTDYCRIAENEGFSVGIAHDLMDHSLRLEYTEAAAVYKLATEKELQAASMAEALNALPERCVTKSKNGRPQLKVIGWGQWASFLQNHLCATLVKDFFIYRGVWGLPDDATNFSAYCDKTFAGLRFYPFVMRFNCNDSAAYHKAEDAGFKITRDTPQLTPAICWNQLCYPGPNKEQYVPEGNPHVNEWHKHNPPPGTVYDVRPRLDHPSLTERGDHRLEQLQEMAPYETHLARFINRKEYNFKPTHEQAMKLYRELLPFNPVAMSVVAGTVQDQPEKYEQLMTNAAALNPGLYFELGDFFLRRNQPDKGAAYFEVGAKEDLDSLMTATYAAWRINYYWKKGKKEMARQVADEAGDVYSSSGLVAKAGYFELAGDPAQAYEWYEKNEDRYEMPMPLIDFCLRYKNKTGDTRFDDALKGRTGKIFRHPRRTERPSRAQVNCSIKPG